MQRFLLQPTFALSVKEVLNYFCFVELHLNRRIMIKQRARVLQDPLPRSPPMFQRDLCFYLIRKEKLVGAERVRDTATVTPPTTSISPKALS